MKNFYIIFFLIFTSYTYSQAPCPGLDSLNYSDQWYHTVQIGSQCWLKENLNVGTMIPGIQNQKNNGMIEKYCYNNMQANCTTFGGLYQWNEAMQYDSSLSGKDVCPNGWHIPHLAEYQTLSTSVGGDGNSLRAVGQGGGTNTSGFTALLAGSYNNNFIGLGNNTYLRSSTETNNWYSYIIGLFGNNSLIDFENNDKAVGLSVRCVQNNVGSLQLQSPNGGEQWKVGTTKNITWTFSNISYVKIELSNNNGQNWIKLIEAAPASIGSYSFIVPSWTSNICKIRISDLGNANTLSISNNVFTIFNDSQICSGDTLINYKGQLYHTIAIGNQCWFKENLNIGNMILAVKDQINNNNTIEKYCYNNEPANCNIYGGLYQWRQAMMYTKKQGARGICPIGWHIPTSADFDSLQVAVYEDGNSLKEIGQGKGTNLSGFSALLSGINNLTFFNNNGIISNFWSSSIYYFSVPNAGGYTLNADNLGVYTYNEIDRDAYHTSGIEGFSIRCLKDDAGLYLQSPYGVEGWQIGSKQRISWGGSNVSDIKIQYTTDNGSNWIIIVNSTSASAGFYDWVVGNTPSNYCKVRISDVANSIISDSSDNIFTIYASGPLDGKIEHGGKKYNTVVIGKKRWFAENLNIGTMIQGSQQSLSNGIIEKYCYNNDTANCTMYGGLYSWSELEEPGFCPAGWHVAEPPIDYVIFDGDALKKVGQGTGFGTGTNLSGFSALLAGQRNSDGTFSDLGVHAWFPFGKFNPALAYSDILYDTNSIIGWTDHFDQLAGASVRCVNDNLEDPLPVELISFTASVLDNNVKLNWTTATEVNTFSFEIEKKTTNNNSWEKIASVKASGNSTSPKQYSYLDKTVNSDKNNYRLKMVDLNGFFKYSNIINIEIAPPDKFELSNAYPNPWNPTTTIRYKVPVKIMVTIKVFDALGREVTTLVNEIKAAGKYDVNFSAKNLSSGVYYYEMKAGNFIDTKKILLLK
jgi:uncharacterized protein (TIGR02145 family)